MIIGIPKEIKKEEYRVAVTPENVTKLSKVGNIVLVENNAGVGSGFSDEEYEEAGASIVDKKRLFEQAELIVKVKEPIVEEFNFFKEGQALFTFLHLAPNRILTEFMLKRKITGLAYETLEVDGTLPLLFPMSEIAGRMSPLVGAYFLQKFLGGSGILPTGTSTAKPAKIVVIGAGGVGGNAVRVAFGMDMETVVMAKTSNNLQKLKSQLGETIKTVILSEETLFTELKDADIVVGAVLIPGGRTPQLVKKDMLKVMKKGAVVVDVSIDQGGCFETSRPTTHDNPVYIVDGVVHYAVANMPGAYPRTSTIALSNATLPYIIQITQFGLEKTIAENSAIRTSLNTYEGRIMNKALAEAYKNSFVCQ